ncbi:MAG: ATP-binding protein, partial [Dysgonamonadaceae bacterium]|nr:ATP-binding protein [Dysgonamonadaceae bacterium]
ASGVKQNLSGKDVVAKYKLGTSANVIKIKKNLLSDEIIDIQSKTVSFVDPVYELWFKREIL